MTELQKALEIMTSGQVIAPAHFRDVLNGILEGAYSEVQIAGFLTAFSCTPLTKENLLEAVTLLRSKMVPVSAPDNAVDCCGTGGDAAQTGGSVNISTAVAFLLQKLVWRWPNMVIVLYLLNRVQQMFLKHLGIKLNKILRFYQRP